MNCYLGNRWSIALLVGVLAVCAQADHPAGPTALTCSFDQTSQRLTLKPDSAVHYTTSSNGFVTLTSGNTVLSSDPESPFFTASLAGVTAPNLREIQLAGGHPFTVGPFTGASLDLKSTGAILLSHEIELSHTLRISAPSITLTGHIRIPGGSIEFNSGNETRILGTLDVSSGTRGGNVCCLGAKVILNSSACINVSGPFGGGEVLLGGDYLGEGGIPTAQFSRFERGAEVRADAILRGDGGRVIVWSDRSTAFHGRISARGGSETGNGGFVEVSGKVHLDFTGTVDTGASNGSAGTLLLDPANITIQAMSPDINGDTTTGDNLINAGQLDNAATDFMGANSIITDGALETVLSSGNVTLAATNSINVNSVINLNSIGTTTRTLTFNAGASIFVNGGGGFSATGATVALNLVFNADTDGNSNGRFYSQGNIETNGGSLTMNGRDTVGMGVGAGNGVFIQADINTAGGSITMTGIGSTNGIQILSGSDVLSGGGEIALTGTGTTVGILLANGSLINAGAGNTTLTADRINVVTGATPTSLSGTGNLTFQPFTVSDALLVGGAGTAVTDFLIATEIAQIANGFNSIVIGAADSSGAITVPAAGVTFNDTVVLRTSGATNINGVLTTTGGAGVTLINGGTATLAAAASIQSDGHVTQTGTGPVALLGPISTTNDPISFAGPVTTTGTLPALTAGTGTVTFNNALSVNGASTGTLAITGNLVFGAAATLNLTADGAGASMFDLLTVTGTVTVGGTLTPQIAFTLQVGDSITFIDNDGTDTVSGAFANQAPGSALTVGNTKLLLAHNFGTGNDVTFTINRVPVVNSISITPTNPVVGQNVRVTVSATDPDNQPGLSLTYNYGDGVSDSSAMHVYAAAGEYTLMVTANDGIDTVTSTMTVTIVPEGTPGAGGGQPSPNDPDGDGVLNVNDPDDDNDGFSDILEELAGTSGIDATITPGVNNAPAGTPGPLTITQMAIKLNFAKADTDSIQISGTLLIPDSFQVDGQKVLVDVGGVTRTFTLNAKGQSPKALDTLKLSIKAKKSVVLSQAAKYQLKFNKGTYAAALADDGLTSADLTKQNCTVRVQMVFNRALLEKNQIQIYSAKTGKSGKTSSPK